MNTLVLSVGIAVTFLTVWGVIMVGGYLIGREPSNASPAAVAPGQASGIARLEPAVTVRRDGEGMVM